MSNRITDAWNVLTKRDNPAITLQQYAELVSFNGNSYLVGALNQTLRGKVEEIDGSFSGLVQQAYKVNGVVFACMLARQQIFTQARFQFQELRNGRPGKFFGSPALNILEHPWPNGVTGDLLARAIQDVDLGGNFFAVRRAGKVIRRLRPDWVTFVLGSRTDPNVEAGDIDAEVLGYIYHPGGRNSGRQPEALLASEVCHFAPIPDPVAMFRGMSWLTPIMREISGDKSMTEHKLSFLANGATPNIIVSLDANMKSAESPQAFAEWIEMFKKINPTGSWDQFKTWYIAGGTKIDVVGSTLQQIDYRAVQGAGEVRICIAAGVPAPIVGVSEGLQGSALNEGNYKAAKRKFVDFTIRDLWQNFSGSMETLVPPPAGSRLWVDDRDIPALAEDKKDLAEVHNLEAQQMNLLITGGFEPGSIVEAITAGGDWTRLTHTGLFSVQLQPPNSAPQIPATVPARDDLVAYAELRSNQRLTEALVALIANREQPQIPATITVTPPDVHVAPPDFTGLEDAMRALATRPDPVVNVAAPEVNVAAPDMSSVIDLAGAVRSLAEREQAPPIVNIAGLAVQPPDVHVDAPVIHVEPLSEETVLALTRQVAPVVNVAMPDRIGVDILTTPPEPKKKTRVTKRNPQGQVQETETETV